MQVEIKYKKIFKEAKEPTGGTSGSAGSDLYAVGNYDIAPHSTVKVHTGIAVEIPPGTFGAIFARSGLATKKGLRPANCVGVVDSDYRGEVIVALHNDTDEMMSVDSNERVAQLVVLPYIETYFTEVDWLSSTERGGGGFGSTGK